MNDQDTKASCNQGPMQSRPETDNERHERWVKEEIQRNRQLQHEMQLMAIEMVRLRQALLFIQDWKFPQPNYVFTHGSNGERDFMRAVATNALNGIS